MTKEEAEDFAQRAEPILALLADSVVVPRADMEKLRDRLAVTKEFFASIKKHREEFEADSARFKAEQDAYDEARAKRQAEMKKRVASFSEPPDYYAGLEGSGWNLVPEPYTPREEIKATMSKMNKAHDAETKDCMTRFTYLISKLDPTNALDLTCLDLDSMGHYLDSILYDLRTKGDWAEYKRIYDLGIWAIERLQSIYSQDKTIPLDGAIHSILSTYEFYNDIIKA